MNALGEPLLVQAECQFVGRRRRKVGEAIVQAKNEYSRGEGSRGHGGIAAFQPPQRVPADEKSGRHIRRGNPALAPREREVTPQLAKGVSGGKRNGRDLWHEYKVCYSRLPVNNGPL